MFEYLFNYFNDRFRKRGVFLYNAGYFIDPLHLIRIVALGLSEKFISPSMFVKFR